MPIKVIKGNISGHVSYETWKGIPITLDKYKTDPRQCSLEMLKLLLPSFTAVSPSPIKSTPVPKSDQRDRSGRPASLQPRLPNVSGAYSRQDTEIVYKNWQYQSCTLHLVKHESLELRGSVPKAASMEGDLHVSYSASISYDGANTTDVLRAYDPSYRSPKAACEALHPQLEEYRSLITIISTATGFVYEELVQSPSVRQPTLQRKAGDRWPGEIKFLDSNRYIQFDGARIFTRV